MATSVFDSYRHKIYPHRFSGRLQVDTLVGGTPTDPRVAEGWLKKKLVGTDAQIHEQVAQTMIDRGVTADEAAVVVNEQKNLNGFRRDKDTPLWSARKSGASAAEFGELYIEGRQLKAALKEAASVAVAAGNLSARGWGTTNKGMLGYLAEHVIVVEDRLHLGVTEATGVMQRFVHTFRGTGIQYEEYVTNAVVDFTVISDHDFTDDQWKTIWITGEQQGLGASRSQGFGRYAVVAWEKIDPKAKPVKKALPKKSLVGASK